MKIILHLMFAFPSKCHTISILSHLNNLLFFISYLGIFASIIFAASIFDTIVNVVFFTRTVVAARVIHSKLLNSVFRSTFRWLDETPTARVIARCTQDIRTIDGQLSHSMCYALDQFLEVAIRLGIIVVVTPFFVIPGIVVGFFGALVGVLYLKAQLSMKREMRYDHFNLVNHLFDLMIDL